MKHDVFLSFFVPFSFVPTYQIEELRLNRLIHEQTAFKVIS